MLGREAIVVAAACLALTAALALAMLTSVAIGWNPFTTTPPANLGYYNPFAETRHNFTLTRCFACHYNVSRFVPRSMYNGTPMILMGKGVVTLRHPHFNCTQCHGLYYSGSEFALAYGDTGPHMGGHPVINCTCCHDPATASRTVFAATGVLMAPVNVPFKVPSTTVGGAERAGKGDLYLVFAIGFAVGAFSSCIIYEVVGRKGRS